MEILSAEEMAAKLYFATPLKPEKEERESIWCIPFEYGSNGKGCRISISKAREIAAQLRADIAEAEKRELFRSFKREEERAVNALQQSADWQQKFYVEQNRANIAEHALRRIKRGRK